MTHNPLAGLYLQMQPNGPLSWHMAHHATYSNGLYLYGMALPLMIEQVLLLDYTGDKAASSREATR
jgi:hypothetical protein